MRNAFTAVALVCAGAAVLTAEPAQAHVVVGNRLFPVIRTFDDPGVGDAATLRQFTDPPTPGGQDLCQFQWEYDETITPNTALIYNQSWSILQQQGVKTHTGLENAILTGKWQAITLPQTESVISPGVMYEFPGGAAAQSIGGDETGATLPTFYFGQGLGALPIGLMRPLAITGELGYDIPDHRLNIIGDNRDQPYCWAGGLSLQYSIPYLQSQVKNIGLADFFGRMIPLVEMDWFSPAAGPAHGYPQTLTFAPGLISMGDTYPFGLELPIPANNGAGHHIGVSVQVHFFFADMFPNALGKPRFA